MSESTPNVKDIFDQAAEIDSSVEREAYLANACADASELRREVDALLQAYTEAGSFLEKPVVAPMNLAETPIFADLETVTLPTGTKIRHVGNYELLTEIGRGAMGVVYRATDAVLGREVAIKVLSDRFAPDSGASRRFTDEARIAGQLQHPGIPAVHDLGTLPDGRPFLAMKLVKGRTLAELLKDRSDPAADRVRLLTAFEQVAHAVAFAHAQHVIHRDLKPANIMVGAFSEVQVMDWGLAKVLATAQREPAFPPAARMNASEILTMREAGTSTQDGSILGTPAFMPPEQAGGEIDKLDERADVFGLGAILCVVLTGKPPYVADTVEAVRLMAVRGRLEECFARLGACGADSELIALCQRCLAADRDARPRDAGAVAAAVAAHLAEVEARARRAEVARAEADARAAAEVKTRQVAEEKAAEERKRRKMQLGLAAAVGLLLAGGGAGAWWQDKQATERRAQATRNTEALDDLLGRCERALRENDADRAAAMLGEIDRRLPERGGEAKGDRVERCRLALAVLRELDAIDDFRWTPLENKLPDQRAVSIRWRALFEGLGVVPGETSAETAGTLVSGSLVRDRLLTALDLWLVKEPDMGLQAILRAADPDPYRDLVRDATATANRGRLVELADRPAALAQPPRFAAALGQLPSLPAERQRAVLLAAQRSRHGDLTLLMELGGSYRRKPRQGAEEARWYQAAVAAHSQNLTTHNNLGIALRNLGELDGAISEFREAIRLDPKTTSARNNLGSALRVRGDLDGAIAEYQEVIRLDPTNANARNGLGGALKNKGDTDGAIAEYKKAIHLDPKHAHAHSNLGLALRDKGDRDGAIVEFRTAIRIDPEFAPAHYHLGVALANKGKLDEAIAECREAIRLDPNDPDAHNNLGTILCDVKRDYDGAIACFKEAIRIKKDAASHCNLGNALVGKGDENAAIAEFREAIRIDPNDADAHTNLGAILCDVKRDYDAAIACFKEAIRIKKDDVEAHNNLGVALRGKGDTDGAIAQFQEALRLNPKFALAHDNLGNALTATGDLKGAVFEFREAARLGLRAPGLQARILMAERWRELTPRLEDRAVGRGGPDSPAEGCELAELAARPFQRQYLLAVRLYQRAFAASPKFAAMHNYNAACAAALSAAGRDIKSPSLGVEEWGYLTGLAHEWLRADLAAWENRVADPKQAPTTHRALSHWKQDPDLITVRDPVWLAAMPEADQKRWQSLWSDVDALLAKVGQSEKSGK